MLGYVEKSSRRYASFTPFDDDRLLLFPRNCCKVAWGASGEGAVGGPGPGGVLNEDVVLPPQADSWMRAAVQQELMSQQLHEQANVQQYQQQQQQHFVAGAGAGAGGMPPQGMVLPQQPILNAQVREHCEHLATLCRRPE